VYCRSTTGSNCRSIASRPRSATGTGQGRGLGASLLQDAILRVIGAGETIGVRAILVHAVSEEARAFYEHWGLRPSPVEPMTLMITVADARRMLEEESGGRD
jgi:hypothetical protein